MKMNTCILCKQQKRAYFYEGTVKLPVCFSCYPEWRKTVPCDYCGLPATENYVDTEDDNGTVYWWHSDCWKKACEVEGEKRRLNVINRKVCRKCDEPVLFVNLCKVHYYRDQYKRTTVRGGKWAKNYEKCINCHETRLPHHSGGRCESCYTRFRRAKRASRMTRKATEIVLSTPTPSLLKLGIVEAS